MSEHTHYDIIIVGGGMVGSALACALGESSLRIALIEGREPPRHWPEDSVDLRVSAISRASRTFFEKLGVWDEIGAMRATPYTEMHVWDASGHGSIHFDSAEIGEPNLGHIIENRVINKALFEQAQRFANIHLYCPHVPTQLHLDANGVQLELDGEQPLHGSLVVGADGGQSWVRQQAGIPVKVSDYQQTAIAATVRTQFPHRNTAWQRFLPSGPLAFLPLADPRLSSIVWSTHSEQAERLYALDEAGFNGELEEAFEEKLGKVLHSGPRGRFPIKAQHAAHYIKPHLALVGDAAHTIHPLAGQGVNLGFADARCLAEVILGAHHAQAPLDSLKTLRRYERARRGENLIMLESMGLFKHLFSNTNPGLRLLRNTGLQLANCSGPLKRLFMDKALG